jgi:YggT family protein
MFILANFIGALAAVVNILLTIMYWLILIRALISWVNPDPFNPLVQFLVRTTEWVLEPVRRLLPPLPIDVSPIIVFFIILFLQRFLVASLYDLALRLHGA